MPNKPVLMISFYFPPQTSVGGFRTEKFVRNLPDYGVEPIVMTVANPDPQFHPVATKNQAVYRNHPNIHYVKQLAVKPFWQIPTGVSKRLLRLVNKHYDDAYIASHFLFIDLEYGWVLPALKQATKIIKQFEIETVYVSCPPFSSSVVGYLLKKLYGDKINLLLDFRDIWFLNAENHSDFKTHGSRLAKNVVASADQLIVCTQSSSEYYQARVPKTPIHTINNSYSDEFRKVFTEGTSTPNEKPTDSLSIIYAGSWDTAGRTPNTLFAALANCDFPWNFTCYGGDPSVLEMAKEHGIENNVKSLNSLPKQELAQNILHSDLIFSIQGHAYNSKWAPYIAAKEYDHLATGKPILAEMPEGDNHKILLEYASKVAIVQPGDISGMMAALNAMYQSIICHKQTYHPRADYLSEFSESKLTSKLARLILQ